MGRQQTTDQGRGYARAARKAAHRDLAASGFTDAVAEAWCAAWEAEATRQGLSADSRFFWDAGRGWIDAQRSFARRRRLERAG